MKTISLKSEKTAVLPDRAKDRRSFWGRLLTGILVPLGIYSVFLITEGQSPLTVYAAMVTCFTGNAYNVGEIFVQMTPILFAAVAALLPGRVGMHNCGGEGQLIIGALAASIAGVYLCADMPGYIGIPIILLCAVAAGMLWGAIPLACYMLLGMNETLTTLLLNYVATRFVAFMVYGPVKDPNGNNYPMTAKLSSQLRLPTFGGTRANFMIFIAAGLCLFMWYFLNKTEIGFRMKAIGGNQTAARFSGLPVKRYQCIAFLAGAAIAGFAGGVMMTGIEFQMRETTCAGLGFMGFLANGIVGNNPALAILSAAMLAILSVCGTTLELTTGLRSASSTILMSVILIVIFCLGKEKRDQ